MSRSRNLTQEEAYCMTESFILTSINGIEGQTVEIDGFEHETGRWLFKSLVRHAPPMQMNRGVANVFSPGVLNHTAEELGSDVVSIVLDLMIMTGNVLHDLITGVVSLAYEL